MITYYNYRTPNGNIDSVCHEIDLKLFPGYEFVSKTSAPVPYAEIQPPSYAELRRIDYPSIGDQLDALWKGGDSAAAMLEKILEVKARHPKP